MQRNGWGTASSIYTWVSGVFDIVAGIGGIVVFGFSRDGMAGLTNRLRPFVDTQDLEFLTRLAALPIIASILLLLAGIGRCVVGYGLFNVRYWGLVGGAIFHFLSLTGALMSAVMLIWLFRMAGLSVLPFLFFIANVVLLVGLLLRDTRDLYAGGGGGGSYTMRQTQFAMGGGPAFPPAPPTAAPFNPPPPPPTQTYAQPRRGGVAKTEVAGPKGPAVIAWLVERSGPRPGKEHRLGEETTLGRDPDRCQITFEDSKISSEHARIRFDNGRYVLFDLASKNHTYVNNQEIQRHALNDGDHIRLGPNMQLTFMQAKRR